MSTDASDKAAERDVLGALIAMPRYLDGVLTDANLRASHFFYERHQEVFKAMVAMHEGDRLIDSLTLNAELRERGVLKKVGDQYVAELFATCPAASGAVDYARIVVREAEWRLRGDAHTKLSEAIATRDRDQLADVEALLETDLTHDAADFEPEDLKDTALRILEGKMPPAFPWPFRRLNDLSSGGLRRGQFVLVGGHSSHGKSQFIDQTLSHLFKKGLRVRLYMNEMDLEERVTRSLSRKTSIPYEKIINGKLDQAQHLVLNKALNDETTFPFGVTFVPGWSANDIAHHVRRHRYDVVAVDILHLIEYADERDLSAISATFARCAKQANCVLIAAVHLNENRVKDLVRPRPSLGDIRGSGALKNDADVVCFVYRKQHEKTGDPEPEGSIYLAKVRNGKTGGMNVHFRERDLTFIPQERQAA